MALFFLGARLPDLLGPAPAVVAPTGSPSPSASPGVVLGPVEPGEYAWDELLGGECLDPYWVTHGRRRTWLWTAPTRILRRWCVAASSPRRCRRTTGCDPGEDVVQAQVLASAVDRASSIRRGCVALTDAVVQASYPTEEVWNEGGRDYFCFVTRSTGEPITGSIALPQVAPPAPAPAT